MPREGVKIRSVFLVLVGHELLHEQVVDLIQLLVAVQGTEKLLAVFHDGLENDQAEVLGGGLVGFVVHGGEEGHIGLAVHLDGVYVLQLDVVAVLVGEGDEIRAEILAHGKILLCGVVCIVPDGGEKSKGKEVGFSADTITKTGRNGE